MSIGTLQTEADLREFLRRELGSTPELLREVQGKVGERQPLDADLTAIAALVTTVFGRSLLTLADAAALRTAVDVLSRTQSEPWLVDINPFMVPATQTNWSTLQVDAACLMGGYKRGLVQNSEIGWDVVLSAGTWTVALMGVSDTDAGIYTVSLDGTSIGTQDFYAAALARNAQGQLSTVVAAAGKKRLTLKMATKNGASAGYKGNLQMVRLIRTA